MNTTPTAISGPSLILEGFNLLWHKEIRWLVLVPLLINLLLFISATGFIGAWVDGWFDWLMVQLPGWLDWLVWALWILFALLILVVYAYTFTLVANLIGSPFYGIVAEKVILLERGQLEEEPFNLSMFLDIAWRSFKRELSKLGYFLPRTIGIALLTLLVSFIPLLNMLGPVIAGIWAAWSLAIQYLDYPADIDRVDFPGLRIMAAEKRVMSIGFGFSALAAAAIPLLNLLLLPATVIGGTLLWCRSYSTAQKPKQVGTATPKTEEQD